jgi:hypothetical protein
LAVCEFLLWCEHHGPRSIAVVSVETLIGNHNFRGTDITAFLKNDGAIKNVAAMANRASTKTTQLYDRRRDDISLDEVERISI